MTSLHRSRGTLGFWLFVGFLTLCSLYFWPWVSALIFGLFFGTSSILIHSQHSLMWTLLGIIIGFWVGVSLGFRSLYRRLNRVR